MTKWYVGEVREVHEGGAPPGFGGGGGHPDQGLPGYGHPGNRPPGSWGGPVDPGWGGGPPIHVGGGPLPPPIPGIWPPLTPDRPAQPLPPGSGWKPGTIWPGAGHPDQDLPGRPPHIGGGPAHRPPHASGQPLPPGSTAPPPTTKPPVEGPPDTKPEQYVVLCWISGGIGWNYVVVDTSLSPGTPLPEAPPTEAAPKKV